MTLRVLFDGAIAGILTTVTGYWITGRLFHAYQARTPNTWRSTESWTSYLVSTGLRLFACIAIAGLYGVLDIGTSAFGRATLPRGAIFGVGLWAITAAPADSRGGAVRQLASRVRRWTAARLVDRVYFGRRCRRGGFACRLNTQGLKSMKAVACVAPSGIDYQALRCIRSFVTAARAAAPPARQPLHGSRSSVRGSNGSRAARNLTYPRRAYCDVFARAAGAR